MEASHSAAAFAAARHSYLASLLPAPAKSWRISNFQDTITVNSDGSAMVNETITLNFVGEWHGIHRDYPHRISRTERHQLPALRRGHQRHR